jgi:hypothetical protein
LDLSSDLCGPETLSLLWFCGSAALTSGSQTLCISDLGALFSFARLARFARDVRGPGFLAKHAKIAKTNQGMFGKSKVDLPSRQSRGHCG